MFSSFQETTVERCVEVMLDYHKANNADITIAAMPVPIEEASRFGILITDETNRITEFEEKTAGTQEQSGFHGNLHIQLAGAEGSSYQDEGRAGM